MTEIERKALALVNEVREEANHDPLTEHTPGMTYGCGWEALCRAIEKHEAYKQEVSDAVEADIKNYEGLTFPRLRRFILPKPVDPLVEALCHCVPLTSEQGSETPAEYVARAVREFLANQGLAIKIVEDKQ